jgi:nucleoside 2-deoxyribosyltransferase
MTDKTNTTELACGIIMPISPIDGCSAEHWIEIKNVIVESIEAIDHPKFLPRLVSDADDIGVIQKRIVQNVYSADIIVCDVSGKNPNVMFELGMRLAFDKPTVIIIDDKTDYSFDTGIIEHIKYPRDLRFSRIVDFKKLLSDKVKMTYQKSLKDKDHSTFLKNFGKFQVSKLEETVVSSDKIVFDMLSEMQMEFARMRRTMEHLRRSTENRPPLNFDKNNAGVARVMSEISNYLEKAPKNEIQKIVGDSGFMEFIESKVDAKNYFSSPLEFKRAYREAIELLMS